MKISNVKNCSKNTNAIFQNMPKNLPCEPYDYQPNLPKKFYQIPPLSTKFADSSNAANSLAIISSSCSCLILRK